MTSEPPGAPLASRVPATFMLPTSILTVPPPVFGLAPRARTKPPALIVSVAARSVISLLPTSRAPPLATRSSRAPTSMIESALTVTGALTTQGFADGIHRSSAVVADRRPGSAQSISASTPRRSAQVPLRISLSRSAVASHARAGPGRAGNLYRIVLIATEVAAERQGKELRERDRTPAAATIPGGFLNLLRDARIAEPRAARPPVGGATPPTVAAPGRCSSAR